MYVLAGMVNLVYHVEVGAYVRYTTTADIGACETYCSTPTYVAMFATSILSAGVAASTVPGGWSSKRCVCVTGSEYSTISSCRVTMCNRFITGLANGEDGGYMQYNLSAGSCSDTVSCRCGAGYYVSGSICAPCLAGSYCPGPGSSFGISLCPAGRIAPSTGMSTCSSCSAGTYSSSSRKLCVDCPSYYPPDGTTPSPVSATSAMANGNVAGCYVASNSSFTDDTGVWSFVSNCYYVS